VNSDGGRAEKGPTSSSEAIFEMTSSFEAIFDQEYGRVVRLIYAMTRSDDVARDAAQDAFTRLYERWGSVSNPAGFVRTVAINRARDQRRHMRVHRRFVARSDRREKASPEADYLFDALATLPLQRRAMVVLRFYEQRSVDEIAYILDLPSGTVKSGLSRSMAHLKETLA